MSCSRLLFSSRDDVIGKVCITRDMLAEHPKGRGTSGQEGPNRDLSPTPAMSRSRGAPPVNPHEGSPLFPQATAAG